MRQDALRNWVQCQSTLHVDGWLDYSFPLFLLPWHTLSLSPSLTSTLLFPSLSPSTSPSFPPAICRMRENRRDINRGNKLHLFLYKLGVRCEVIQAMLLKNWRLERCYLSLQHVSICSNQIAWTPVFTPHLLNPSTPKYSVPTCGFSRLQ